MLVQLSHPDPAGQFPNDLDLFSCYPMPSKNKGCDDSMLGRYSESCIKTHITPNVYAKQIKQKPN